MRNLFVSALSLIFFECFIILCYGGNRIGMGKISKIDVTANQSELPNDLIADILFRAGFETTTNAAKGNIRTKEVIERIFQNYIIVINPIPVGEHEQIVEFAKNGKRFLEIRNYDKLKRLFESFGKNVRKIHIYYHSSYIPYYTMPEDIRLGINNMIREYRKQLTELAMYASRNSVPYVERIWDEIPNEKGELHFPKVKKFKYIGYLKRKPFDVNQIFPSIESIKLRGTLDDGNCLKNLRNLKELYLHSESIGGEKFAKIIANNKQINKLTICNYFDTAIKTVQSIAETSKNLKTLIVRDIWGAFFLLTDKSFYNLTSVTSFSYYGAPENLYKNLSFDMPNLENLKMVGWIKGDLVAKFINRFHKLKTVYLHGMDERDAINCIKHLIHVKEYVLTNFRKIQLTYLEVIFKNLKEKSNLNTIKWIDFDESEYQLYVAKMNEINLNLKESRKPTWQISHGYEESKGETKPYLMLKRNHE